MSRSLSIIYEWNEGNLLYYQLCVLVVDFLANSQTFSVTLACFHAEVANHYIQLSIKEVPHNMTIFQEKIRQFVIVML